MPAITDLTQTLNTIPWFLELKPFQLERLSRVASIHTLQAGQVLFREGDRVDMLYILLDGEIALETHVPQKGLLRLLVAEPLDILGWSSLTPVVRQRTTTACVLKTARLLVFDGEALRRLCEEDHDIGFVIMRRVANVVASRLLITRLQLFDVILVKSQFPTQYE